MQTENSRLGPNQNQNQIQVPSEEEQAACEYEWPSGRMSGGVSISFSSIMNEINPKILHTSIYFHFHLFF